METDRTRQNLAELWCAVFGEAPTIATDPEITAGVLVRCLAPVEPYAPALDEKGAPASKPKTGS